MSHAVEIFLAEQFFNRFVIGRVGLHNLFDKCQAVYPIQFYLKHFFHKEPDKRIAVGMQTIWKLPERRPSAYPPAVAASFSILFSFLR